MATLTYLDETNAGTAADLPIGYRCLGAGGEPLGDVAGILVDQSTQQQQGLVLRTGNWLTERRYLVPMDQVSGQDDAGRTVVLDGVTRDALKNGRFPEYREGETTSDTPRQPRAEETTPGPVGEQQLDLQAEVLHASAEPYEAGRVRIGKRVVEHEETVTVPLREELLVIEHTGGEGSVRVGDRELAPGETMEIVLYKERARVEKAVERQEAVLVRKEQVQHTEQVRATVRREELEVREGAELLSDASNRAETAGNADSRPAAEQPSPLPSRSRTRAE